VYNRILADFGFSSEKDELARDRLAHLIQDKMICDPDCLDIRIEETVTVCGHGPNLEKDLEENELIGTIISADGATAVLFERGIIPHLITTDLDGDIESQVICNELGAVAIIHAHGDNIERLGEGVPMFNGLITPTTQCEPIGRVYNFGGFTDGDRAVMLGRHFMARRIKLLGFDFERPRETGGKDSVIKKRKLEWARRLIYEMNPPGIELIGSGQP